MRRLASTPLRRCSSGLILLLASVAWGQTGAELDPIVVTASRSRQALAHVPASVSVVDRGDIQEGRLTIGIDEALNRVAGVLTQNSSNYAQDIRLQIRGFGGRSEFGVREVRVLLDGFPETLPDGQTDLDHIDMGAIDHIEVLRGPASSLYGNASGGVVQLFTEAPPDQPRVRTRFTGGSYGLGKYEVKGGGRLGALGAFFHASYLQLDGYRDHATAQATTLTAKLRYDWSPETSFTLLLNGVDAPLGDDPGGLQRAEADRTPRQANSRNVQFDAGEEVQQGRIGLSGTHLFDDGELTAYAYVLYRDFANRLPIGPPTPAERGGMVTFYRLSPGGGARYAKEMQVLGLPHTLSVGIDVQHQADDRQRFANLNGQRGERGLEQHEEVTGIGPYLRHEVALTDKLTANLGVRYDTVHFAVAVDQPTNSTASGSRTLDAWSPSAGLVYQALPNASVFVNVGSAFQTPTTTELANPAGAGFNPDVGPQRAWSGEIGTRAEGKAWTLAMSGFFIHVDDVLVRYEISEQPGRAFFRNAAHVQRYGVEMEWQAMLLQGLRWTSALTAMETNFSAGPAEPGVPPWQVYQELRYDHGSGAFAAVEAFAVDAYSVNTSGRASTRAYELCNLRSGYRWENGPLTVEPFLGLNNLTNTNYDSRVRINDANQRYYEPGPRFNVYGGISLQATL